MIGRQNSNHLSIFGFQVCTIMTNTTIGPQIDRLAAVNALLLAKDNQTCLDYKYDKMIGQMQNVSWDSDMASGSKCDEGQSIIV